MGLIKKVKSMVNFEKETVEFLNGLSLELRERLVEILEWEKELSWSNGYADAEEQLSESI
jgi:hypothetical protein